MELNGHDSNCDHNENDAVVPVVGHGVSQVESNVKMDKSTP
jgi:hypothetical protein